MRNVITAIVQAWRESERAHRRLHEFEPAQTVRRPRPQR